MPEGKNKAEPRRGHGSIHRKAVESLLRSRRGITSPNIGPAGPQNVGKSKVGANPGAGPASVADMETMKRSGHTARETRKKSIKNIKGAYSEKRAQAAKIRGRQPIQTRSVRAGQYVPGSRGRLTTAKGLRRTPGRNPSKKEKR